jgi:uncharacterized membrane protein
VESIVEPVIRLLSQVADAGAGLAIGYGILRALVAFVVSAVRGPTETVPREAIRLDLGRSLALGLEFQLAADVLKTAIAPTWEQISLVAAIAAIRTFLNYFLSKELDRASEVEAKQQQQAAVARPE